MHTEEGIAVVVGGSFLLEQQLDALFRTRLYLVRNETLHSRMRRSQISVASQNCA